MIAALIFMVSVATLLQFFVSYSRSLIVASRRHELSEEACEICGFTAQTVAGDKFGRLLQLISLCPEPGVDGLQVRAVAIYFRLLDAARLLLGVGIPSAATWIESERSGCAYAAAVVLDRRIAYSRSMLEHQAGR
jgi:hypothetical protein